SGGTPEHVGRGDPVGARPRLSVGSASGLWFVVTCHVAARPQPCRVQQYFRQTVPPSLCFVFCWPIPPEYRLPTTTPQGPFRYLPWSLLQPACPHQKTRSAAASRSS